MSVPERTSGLNEPKEGRDSLDSDEQDMPKTSRRFV